MTIDYHYYTSLIMQSRRVNAFWEALRERVSEDAVVVEIGTGLGTFSMFAAQHGASHVYAIEQSAVSQVAEELVRLNGLDDRVTIVEGISTQVTLPVKGDVLVFEDFSSLFIRQGLEELLNDAFDRHLKPGACVIPEEVTLYMAPVGDEELWSSCLQLQNDDFNLHGLKLDSLRRALLNSPHSSKSGYLKKLSPEALLAPAQPFRSIRLQPASNLTFDECLSFVSTRTGTIFGIAAWFDMRLSPGCAYTNAPHNPATTWGQVFLPIEEPLKIREKETVLLRIACSRSSVQKDVWLLWQVANQSDVQESSWFKGIPLHTPRVRPKPAHSLP
jgi:hypothetical protein